MLILLVPERSGAAMSLSVSPSIPVNSLKDGPDIKHDVSSRNGAWACTSLSSHPLTCQHSSHGLVRMLYGRGSEHHSVGHLLRPHLLQALQAYHTIAYLVTSHHDYVAFVWSYRNSASVTGSSTQGFAPHRYFSSPTAFHQKQLKHFYKQIHHVATTHANAHKRTHLASPPLSGMTATVPTKTTLSPALAPSTSSFLH